MQLVAVMTFVKDVQVHTYTIEIQPNIKLTFTAGPRAGWPVLLFE